MDSLNPRPPFQILIMSEESRLGRDQIRMTYALQESIDAGVRIWVYLDNREITLADATQTAMAQLRGFGAAIEREGASKRTHDALTRKAKALQVTGGRVYGFLEGDVLRSHRPCKSHLPAVAAAAGGPSDRVALFRNQESAAQAGDCDSRRSVPYSRVAGRGKRGYRTGGRR